MSNFQTVRRDSLVRYLSRHVAGEVRFDDTSRRLYATDASLYQVEPLGVVVPKTVEDLTVTVQIAAELGVPITARGGGTSLSGQSIGTGIVIDCSKYLNQIGEVDSVNRTVRVQPGVVLERLNQAVAAHGLQFGPDVAPANRATLGGMIGNNSAGARSVVYGKTDDHVRALTTVLSDGTRAEFGALSEVAYQRKLELRTREGDIYRTAARVAAQHADEIARRFPNILRRVSGYNLASLSVRAGSVSDGNASPVAYASGSERNLVPLLVGSEGTLAVVAEAELALVPKPAYRGLLVPHFETLQSALDAVGACLEFGPSAVEMLDQMLIDLARNQRSLSRTMAAVHGRPAALLMVEFSGDTQAEVADRVEKLARRLRGIPGMTAAVEAVDPALRDPLWNLRSASMPLLYGMPGDGKPVTFVEDCAVAPARMPEFAARFRDILHKHGTDGAFYGHASVGCLHIRPVLNLHDPGDVRKLRTIMEDVTDLVLAFDGSLSGEHGDGMVRSEWNRKMFGPELYEAFRQVKRAFDPDCVLNPGKVVDGPAMEENLRVPPGVIVSEPPTVFDYSAQGGFFRSVELCNGNGACRKTQGGAMCPSYRVTKDERDTTRGRANALRVALLASTNRGGEGEKGRRGEKSADDLVSPSPLLPLSPSKSGQRPLAQRWITEVMDLCLSCKACKSECPSNVDVAKLKAEFLNAYYAKRPRPLGHLLVKNIDVLSPLGSRWAKLANWLGRRRFARGLLEAVAGIDRRRSLPELHRDHFRKWFAERQPSARQPVRGTRQRVVLLDDCFTTFQEPQIGRAAVELLERAGCDVELANVCCGRAMISKGFLTDARDLARKGVAKLAQAASAGVPILGLEPSCILTLADEWPELVPGPEAKQVAAVAELAEVWFARNASDNWLSLGMSSRPGKVLFHPHCHQRALVGPGGTADALRLIPGADVTVLDAGCCGMAGAFGYEKSHYDVSVAVAELQLIPALKANPDATIVATGTSCRHQIRDLTGRHALHPVEVLAGAEGDPQK
jgi:FAD/FMN-containing dehydrogenase/Fe-S oxidoreductase